MAKTIRVTSAQIAGAKFLVKQAELGGPAVAESVRRLAQARPKQTAAPVVANDAHQLWDVEQSAAENNQPYDPPTRRRPPVSVQEARRVYDGPSANQPVVSSERVEVVREWAGELGVEVHAPGEGIVYRAGSRDNQQFDMTKPAEGARTSGRDKL